MKRTGSEYTHGASAGKNLRLLAGALAAAVLHTLMWGGILLACTVNPWYAAAAGAALVLLLLLRLHAGRRT